MQNLFDISAIPTSMQQLDLRYLSTVIGNMSGVPIRLYQKGQQVFFHSMLPLPKDPILLHEKEIFAVKSHVGYIITQNFDYYGIINSENFSLVIGPARLTDMTEQELRKQAFELDVAPEDIPAFLASMRVIIHMPLESILQILCTINYVIHGEKLGLDDLEIVDSAQKLFSDEITAESADSEEMDLPAEAPSFEIHKTFQAEQQMLDFVRRGDTPALKEWIANAPAIRPGKLAQDFMRQLKNTFIVTVTLVSRSAIRGGMDLEDALRLSDSYIQKCERLTSVAQLQNLQYHMTLNFTEQVEQARYFHSQSDLVADATSYIRHHLSESIRTEDIAKALFISRSHLSTTFKEDSGMNLSDYIHFIKISEAKHLLTHSDKSLLSISIYLGYSSQSHFCRIFKKYTGVSPKDYRLNH